MQQSRQDHGVTDVRDLKFVKAQHPCVRADFLTDAAKRICLLAPAAQAVMDFEHEAMKVHPAAGLGGECVEQAIHD